jgi:hypothetical protein
MASFTGPLALFFLPRAQRTVRCDGSNNHPQGPCKDAKEPGFMLFVLDCVLPDGCLLAV